MCGCGIDMSDPPGHFMLFCKVQKGGLTVLYLEYGQ